MAALQAHLEREDGTRLESVWDSVGVESFVRSHSPVLVPILEARGERGVISSQVELELQRNKLGYPAHPFTLVPDVANSVAMARMRQQFPNKSAQGVEGDIIIGTTAISTGRKLYTSDRALEAAVINAGGMAEYVP